MLNNIVLKLSELYQKANINTTLGSGFDNIVRDVNLVNALIGVPRENFCPMLYAATLIERRKEKYGKKLLDIYRQQGKEQEGVAYLKNHFRFYLNNIVKGEPIPEYPL